MTPIGFRSQGARRMVAVVAAGLIVAALLPFATVGPVLATASLTTAASASISADTASTAPGGGSWTTLNGPVITEGAAGDISPGGNVVLTLSAGSWQFNTGTVTVLPSATVGACALTATSPAVVTTTTITTTIAGTATTGTDRCRLTFSGIQVQPTVTTGLPNTGTIAISYTPSANIVGLAGGSTVGTLTEMPGAAVLSFSQQPSSPVNGGEAFSPNQPKVTSKDQFNNVRAGDVIALTLSGGTSGAALSCTPSTNQQTTDGSGVATFVACKIDKAGSGYVLIASTTGGTNTPTSSSITVNVGPADHLAFLSYPPTTAITSLGTIQVAVQDKGNNTVTSDTRTITLTISANAGSFSCSGGLAQPAVAGVATFSNCTEAVAANGYTITADDGAGGLSAKTGATFNITSGPANKVALCWGTAGTCNTAAPTGFTGGAVWPDASQPQVRVQDVNGNTVTSDNTTAVALSLSTNPVGGTLSCTGGLGKTVTAGVATFAGCSINKAGN